MLYLPGSGFEMPDQLAEFYMGRSEVNVVLHVPCVAPIDQVVSFHRHTLWVVGELEPVLQDEALSNAYRMGAGDLSDDAELGG